MVVAAKNFTEESAWELYEGSISNGRTRGADSDFLVHRRLIV